MEWIHIYYEKGVWDTQVNQAFWIVQKILKAHKHLLETGLQMKRGMEKVGMVKLWCAQMVSHALFSSLQETIYQGKIGKVKIY